MRPEPHVAPPSFSEAGACFLSYLQLGFAVAVPSLQVGSGCIFWSDTWHDSLIPLQVPLCSFQALSRAVLPQ